MGHALIIDDNPKNVEVLVRLLRIEGFSSTTVLRPIQLDAVLDELDVVDVIFLDLEMPGANGYDILDYLRSNERFHGVPIVAYTVHVSEITIAHQHGFHSFLGKPLDADKFPEQFARIMNGQPVWETA